MTQTDGSALSNDQFDALIIGVDVADIILEVRGVDDNGDETVSQFTSKPDGDGYAFNVPSLGASESLHLVTPSFFDGSINLTLKTLSQGSAGDTAMSLSVTQTLEVYSEGDGVDLKVGDANGIEDSIVPVRLPISATRIDTSEEIVSVRLTMATEDFGSSDAAISYVTRIETRMTGIEDIKSLVAEGASFIDAATLGAETPKSVSFTDLSDVSLIVRSAPGYGQNVPSLKSVTDLAGIATAMSDADIDVYAMFLRGTYTTADGNEITTSFAVEDASGVLTDNSMETDPVSNESVPSVAGMYAFQQNVGNAFADGIVTATPNSVDATKTDFEIDIEAAAIDLVAPLIDQSSLDAAQAALAAGSETDEQITLLAEYDQALIQAQQWLTRNLGVDPATEVTGELPIEIGITTRDTNNILSDADGFSEEIVTSGIVNIVDINDLPIITNSSEDSHYFHNNLELHPNIVMEDIDNENFNNGVITVTITPYGESPFELIEGEDEINISTENGISVDNDNNVYFEENVIGSIISSARLGDLRISLNEKCKFGCCSESYAKSVLCK